MKGCEVLNYFIAIFDPAGQLLEVAFGGVAVVNQKDARVIMLVSQASSNDLVDLPHCHNLIPVTSKVLALQHLAGVCHKLVGDANNEDSSGKLVTEVQAFTHLPATSAHEDGLSIFSDRLLVLSLHGLSVV